MSSTKWFIIGALTLMTGPLTTAWSGYNAFQAMKNTESAGIAAVSGGISSALFYTGLGLALGVIALLIGFTQLYRERKRMAPR